MATPMKPVVGVTLFRRPTYSRMVLEALAHCVGFADHRIFIQIDWSERYDQESRRCAQLAHEFSNFKNSLFLWEPKSNFGIDGAKLKLFPFLFQYSPYAIHLEDDMVPAWDFLLFHDWCAEQYQRDWHCEQYRDDPNILTVSAYQNTGPEYFHPMYQFGVTKSLHPNCWGWGVWEDRWQEVIGDERAYRDWAGEKVNGLFDHWWMKYAQEHRLYTVSPRTSRVRNLVGLPGTPNEGTNSNDPRALEGINEYGSWNFDPFQLLAKQEWHE